MISAWFRTPQLAFSDPVEVWSAIRIADVRAAIDRVAYYQQQGYYVVGFISYEAAPAFDAVLRIQMPRNDLPLAWFAAFRLPAESSLANEPFKLDSAQLQTSETNYRTAVRRALNYISTGDIYQVNYTIRARCNFSGFAESLFKHLFRAVPMPYAAFIDAKDFQLVSLSPELFLARSGQTIESYPMKGTAPRKPSWYSDEAVRIALEDSEKDRAENIMIVDLMRNDLGRVCISGTVTVPELCKAVRYPTVHQMISKVKGTLRDDATLFDIFAATFPPGSVTGAPKIRAMKIITELEPEPRGIYCGTIGLFFPNGDFVCNVAIRTLEIHGNKAILGIGSGIVADSNPEQEWKESLLKAKFLSATPLEFGLFETFRHEPSVGFRNLHDHLRRLYHSCLYFSRPFPLHTILSDLRKLREEIKNESVRIRLQLNYEEVSLLVIREFLTWPKDGLTIMLSDVRVDPDDPRLYHKTTARQEKYTELETARAGGADECLFVNTRGEITEGAVSNIMIQKNNHWLTPKLSSGLLPGVWRQTQLDSGLAAEAVLTLDDVKNADAVVMGNSVRGKGCVKQIRNSAGQIIYKDHSLNKRVEQS